MDDDTDSVESAISVLVLKNDYFLCMYCVYKNIYQKTNIITSIIIVFLLKNIRALVEIYQ